MAKYMFLVLGLISLTCSVAMAESSPVQDFCIADPTGTALVNGNVCKDPKLAQADDFFFSGFHIPGNTSNPSGAKVTQVSVVHIPGLNTLGVSMARIDYEPWGINTPHTHPRATEIFTVMEGTLYAAFVTSNPDNRLITKILRKGDVFVFPVGLIHFQQNIGNGTAAAMAAFNSQNPGIVTVANTLFGSNPLIRTEALTKAFQVDKNVVDYLQTKF